MRGWCTVAVRVALFSSLLDGERSRVLLAVAAGDRVTVSALFWTVGDLDFVGSHVTVAVTVSERQAVSEAVCVRVATKLKVFVDDVMMVELRVLELVGCVLRVAVAVTAVESVPVAVSVAELLGGVE